MKKKKGFTLVELVIVIVIVAILSIVAVPIYRGYTRRSMLTEGKSVMANIELSETAYYCEYSIYYGVSQTSFDKLLDVDLRANKYFTTFEVTENGKSFVATTSGSGAASGMSLTLTVNSLNEKSVLTSNGIQD